VFLATLHLVADLVAREVFRSGKLFRCKKLFFEFSRVIDSKASNFAFVFAALALLVY
jgi:hypothetical protein